MNNVKNIFCVFLSILVLLSTIFITETFAAVEYYSDGTPKKIVLDKGTITYYSDGLVESIVTPEGTATYQTDGKIDTITGNPSISLEEAKAELNKLKNSTPNPSNTAETADSSLPNTGIENTYIFLIPILAIVILFLAIRLRKLKNM